MGFYDISPRISVYKGYKLYTDDAVLCCEKCGETQYMGQVKDENHVYSVFVDLDHPRTSKCTCAKAVGRRIICVHKAALFFAASPEGVMAHKKWLEEMEEQDLEYDSALCKEVAAYVETLDAAQLRRELLRLLSTHPRWKHSSLVQSMYEAKYRAEHGPEGLGDFHEEDEGLPF